MVVRTLGVTTGLVGVGGVVCMPSTGALYALKRIVPGLLVHLVRDLWVSRACTSVVAWLRSSAPRIQYQHKYHTDMYRPSSKSTIPIFDRDTDHYRFCSLTKLTDMPALACEPATRYNKLDLKVVVTVRV